MMPVYHHSHLTCSKSQQVRNISYDYKKDRSTEIIYPSFVTPTKQGQVKRALTSNVPVIFEKQVCVYLNLK